MTFDSFIVALKELYAEFTPEFAAEETGVAAAQIVEAARAIGRAPARVLARTTGARGRRQPVGLADHALPVPARRADRQRSAPRAASSLHVSNKFVPKHPNPPPPPDYWNELLFPREYPLAFFEMSFLLPHFLKEGRGKLDVYFTRVYNPVWTNPDGFSWMEMLHRRATRSACTSR